MKYVNRSFGHVISKQYGVNTGFKSKPSAIHPRIKYGFSIVRQSVTKVDILFSLFAFKYQAQIIRYFRTEINVAPDHHYHHYYYYSNLCIAIKSPTDYRGAGHMIGKHLGEKQNM
jgi:hypothetical protein